MHKYIVAACLLTGAPAFSAGPIDRQTGSLLTLAELKKTGGDDTVVLLDGSILYGHFTQIPSLRYSFGKIAFDENELAAIALVRQDNTTKMQFITRMGLSYLGNMPSDSFVFVAAEGSRTIAPSAIDYIRFHSKDSDQYSQKDYFYQVVLKNGDRIPVQLASEQIQVTDGWKTRSLFTKDILEVNYQNGWQGYILDDDGHKKELPSTLIKDKYLNLEIPNQDHIVKIPWNQVTSLAQLEEEALRNLDHALAAELVSSAAIEGLDALGVSDDRPEGTIGFAKVNERKNEPQALFSLLETFDSQTDIVFSDPVNFTGDLHDALGALLITSEMITLAFSDPVSEDDSAGALNVLGRKTEPLALFSLLDPLAFSDEIAFLDEEDKTAEVYHVSSEDIVAISDILNHENLPTNDVDPEIFDVPPLEDDAFHEEKNSGSEEGMVEFLVSEKKTGKRDKKQDIAYRNESRESKSKEGLDLDMADPNH